MSDGSRYRNLGELHSSGVPLCEASGPDGPESAKAGPVASSWVLVGRGVVHDVMWGVAGILERIVRWCRASW